jgi:hypothetical protein
MTILGLIMAFSGLVALSSASSTLGLIHSGTVFLRYVLYASLAYGGLGLLILGVATFVLARISEIEPIPLHSNFEEQIVQPLND